MTTELETLKQQLAKQEAEIAGLRMELAGLRDAVEDIEMSYNMHEFLAGEEISPGHQRCIEMATAALANWNRFGERKAGEE